MSSVPGSQKVGFHPFRVPRGSVFLAARSGTLLLHQDVAILHHDLPRIPQAAQNLGYTHPMNPRQEADLLLGERKLALLQEAGLAQNVSRPAHIQRERLTFLGGLPQHHGTGLEQVDPVARVIRVKQDRAGDVAAPMQTRPQRRPVGIAQPAERPKLPNTAAVSGGLVAEGPQEEAPERGFRPGDALHSFRLQSYW